MKNKISIIVPVYNVEKYVAECIESLLKINLPKEIIVVNDGSKDRSMEIVQDLQKDNKDVIFIYNKENGGLSSARNYGLDQATGDIISFIDSDDWVDSVAFEKMYHEMVSCDLDMIQGNVIKYFEYESEFEKTTNINSKAEDRIVSGIEYLKGPHCHPSCFYLYKKELINVNHLRFEEGILHEDALFTIESIYRAKKIKHTNDFFYIYRQRDGSIMTTRSQKSALCRFYVAYRWSIMFKDSSVYNDKIVGMFYYNVHDVRMIDLKFFIRILFHNTKTLKQFKRMIKCFVLIFHKDYKFIDTLRHVIEYKKI